MKKKRRARHKKIDTIEKLAILTVEGFEQVDRRFDQVDRRFEQIDKQLHAIRTDIADIHAELADINRRITRLEEQGAAQAGYAKEIDYLLARVSRIEKHLKMA